MWGRSLTVKTDLKPTPLQLLEPPAAAGSEFFFEEAEMSQSGRELAPMGPRNVSEKMHDMVGNGGKTWEKATNTPWTLKEVKKTCGV